MARDKEHGADGAHVNSTRYRIMTEGTPEEKRRLEQWLDEARADERAMQEWGLAGNASLEDEEEFLEEEILTPDVDAFLKRRGYKPRGDDE